MVDLAMKRQAPEAVARANLHLQLQLQLLQQQLGWGVAVWVLEMLAMVQTLVV